MNLRLSLEPYRLPLRHPWRSARGEVRDRSGWLVVASAAGIDGFGDCAPLPEAGTETAALARRRLQHWRDLARAQTLGDPLAALLNALASAQSTPTPAADCAVECALLDLRARILGLPLRQLLAADAADRIEVNAALGAAASLTPERLKDAAAQGFRIFKLKVGSLPAEVELDRIRGLVQALPSGGALRLDANGAWDRATAERFVAALAGLCRQGLPSDAPLIDSVEEPLAEPDDQALAALQLAAPCAIALDESLATGPRLLDATRDLSGLPVRRLVLKPGVLGGLRRSLELTRRARSAGLELVLTSLVESAAGLWATAQLAAASGSPLAHGLATADWLARDLGPAPQPRHGGIDLPMTAGSGFEPSGPMS